MRATSPAVEDLKKAGFDLSLIDANLRLDPETRALRHQEALDLAEAFSRSGGNPLGEPEPVAPASVRR